MNYEPFTSRVGLLFASMIGPCQVTSKKVLIAIADGDVEKDLIDGGTACLRDCCARNDL